VSVSLREMSDTSVLYDESWTAVQYSTVQYSIMLTAMQWGDVTAVLHCCGEWYMVIGRDGAFNVRPSVRHSTTHHTPHGAGCFPLLSAEQPPSCRPFQWQTWLAAAVAGPSKLEWTRRRHCYRWCRYVSQQWDSVIRSASGYIPPGTSQVRPTILNMTPACSRQCARTSLLITVRLYFVASFT